MEGAGGEAKTAFERQKGVRVLGNGRRTDCFALPARVRVWRGWR